MWWDHDRRDEFAATCRVLVERFGDIRRLGSAQLQLAMVAAGTLDGVLTNVVSNPWDTVTGVHMVRLAGGRVTDLNGDPWRHDSRGLVASNGGIHDSLLEAAADLEASVDG
jgi:myo-inositol-1(or 4)-monophosphatase